MDVHEVSVSIAKDAEDWPSEGSTEAGTAAQDVVKVKLSRYAGTRLAQWGERVTEP